MRQAPERNPDLEKLKAQTRHAFEADTVSLDLELITPLFGGGVIAKQVDEVCWLRSSEVKANLRFWWRALHGHRYTTSEALHTAEAARFGSAKGSEGEVSPVAVAVKELSRPALLPATSIKDARKLAYFPGQDGMGNAKPIDLLSPGATAKLLLTFRPGLPLPLRSEILKALTAWLLFGGVGSRTRRGAGALAPQDRQQARGLGYPTSLAELDAFLKEHATPVTPFSGQFFSLSNGARLLRSALECPAQQTHINLLDHWRSFRQNRRHPNHWGGGQNWGQNRWPEADLVRDVTSAELGKHRCHEQHHRLRCVPRALLGLPMIIKFPNQPAASNFQLIRRKSERYGSPVWLGVARIWNAVAATHVGLVAVTPSLISDHDLVFEIKHQGRSLDAGPLRAAYPEPRAARSEHEPNAWPVQDAAHMVRQVVKAFEQPGKGHESVASPHFQIIR